MNTRSGTPSVMSWFLRPGGLTFVGLIGLMLVRPAESQAQLATERDLIRQRAAGDDRPWLALAAGGHTAQVQALAFSPDGSRLFSAGLDKAVQVWDLTSAVRDLRRTYLLERTLRWQQGRALRGAIYALAVAPQDGLLAIGGYGASPGLGEIILIDPRLPRLVQALTGHRQAVASLAFSPSGAWLVSVDLEGRALAWRRDVWRSTVLAEPDRVTYGADSADAIERHPRLRPLAVVRAASADWALLSAFAGLTPDGRPQWKLRRVRLDDPRQSLTFDPLHENPLSAIAVSTTGPQWATADGAGALRWWSGDEAPRVETVSAERQLLALSFAPDGKSLYAAGAGNDQAAGELQVWDVATRQIAKRRSLDAPASACAVSADGQNVAVSGAADHAVLVGRIEKFPQAIALRGQGQRIERVAFHAQSYRVAYGAERAAPEFNRYGPLRRSFDPVGLELAGERVTNDRDWLPITNPHGAWQIALSDEGRLRLLHAGQAAGTITLDPRFDGQAQCWCWLTNNAGEPCAVAVGTDVQNQIVVFGLARHGACPIWRVFRGHNDRVTSLSESHDRRYLASGSHDGTIRFWSLAELQSEDPGRRRWGASWQVADGRLRLIDVHPAGPLHFSGARAGDEIARITWADGNTLQQQATAAAIAAQLSQAPLRTQFDFELRRGETRLPPFPRLPGWQPLATLFVAANEEWALWTPEGYYNASANGPALFGWQVNRGLDQLPDFYRADQFRQRLERPDVLERLLEAGSISAAFQLADLGLSPSGDERLRQQIAATPQIEILTPSTGATIRDRVARVIARIEFAATAELVAPRLFAGGVAAPAPTIVGRSRRGDRQALDYAWDARLPSDERNLIQVLASTAEQAVAMQSVVVEQPEVTPLARPRLFLLALGIDHYRDTAIQPLAYSVADATSVLQAWQTRAASLFDVQEPILLTNEAVTPRGWQAAMSRLRERLHDAKPDDLLIVFLAGHGFVDPRSGRYYFAGHDISRTAFERGEHSSSIPWSDFQQLADVPCRKLALLDTCHSGAIQPLRWRHLQSAIRTFQYDQVLTLTASAGHERSEENAIWRHGAFTKTVLDGLQGQADHDGDALVSLTELVAFVRQGVPSLTAGRQNPTAGPSELLPYVSLKVSRVE